MAATSEKVLFNVMQKYLVTEKYLQGVVSSFEVEWKEGAWIWPSLCLYLSQPHWNLYARAKCLGSRHAISLRHMCKLLANSACLYTKFRGQDYSTMILNSSFNRTISLLPIKNRWNQFWTVVLISTISFIDIPLDMWLLPSNTISLMC